MAGPPDRCPICDGKEHDVLYHGPVRTGRFGSYTAEPRTVWRCRGCGAGRLPDAKADYDSADYRARVDGGDDVERFRHLHDGEQAEKLRVLGTAGLRDAVCVDVGCGGGAFLDLLRGLARTTIGIEPTPSLRAAVSAAGHLAFPYCTDVPREWSGRVDVAVAFSLVEHVADPLELLRDIHRLLRSGGRLLISTPNRRDWLLDLLPDDYAQFFYRQVHAWYFDADSLTTLLAAAGFTDVVVSYVHRFDVANAVLWLRDRRPTGLGAIACPPGADTMFRAMLEASGRADYLYAAAGKA